VLSRSIHHPAAAAIAPHSGSCLRSSLRLGRRIAPLVDVAESMLLAAKHARPTPSAELVVLLPCRRSGSVPWRPPATPLSNQ
jgi:hypothetical protein